MYITFLFSISKKLSLVKAFFSASPGQAGPQTTYFPVSEALKPI